VQKRKEDQTRVNKLRKDTLTHTTRTQYTVTPYLSSFSSLVSDCNRVFSLVGVPTQVPDGHRRGILLRLPGSVSNGHRAIALVRVSTQIAHGDGVLGLGREAGKSSDSHRTRLLLEQ
jgi:hypothetical protein